MLPYPLPVQYEADNTNTKLTGLAGIPLYLELMGRCGLIQQMEATLFIREQGWTSTEVLVSLICLFLAGGECIHDIEHLEKDAGLANVLKLVSTYKLTRQQQQEHKKRWRKGKQRAFPSNAALHRVLSLFHDAEQEQAAEESEGAVIIPPNEALVSLMDLNLPIIEAAQRHNPVSVATLDQDATLIKTSKRNARYCYKKHKAFQPLIVYWSEHGVVLHSEFRNGQVNAGFEQLRVLRESIKRLPASVKKVMLRSDSAGYQRSLIAYCAEGKNTRVGVIEFAISVKVSTAFKAAAQEVAAKDWHILYEEDSEGNRIESTQEWAEVCFVPTWAGVSKQQAELRFIGIREKLKPAKNGKQVEPEKLPFSTYTNTEEESSYKLFGIVTNRKIDGNELIQWHRERCGKSEQFHYIQKTELAAGRLPSNSFGVNAAWWHINILAYNLHRLMQISALPKVMEESKLKAIRFDVICLPGRLICHARQHLIRVEKTAYELFTQIRKKIAELPVVTNIPWHDTS